MSLNLVKNSSGKPSILKFIDKMLKSFFRSSFISFQKPLFGLFSSSFFPAKEGFFGNATKMNQENHANVTFGKKNIIFWVYGLFFWLGVAMCCLRESKMGSNLRRNDKEICKGCEIFDRN